MNLRNSGGDMIPSQRNYQSTNNKNANTNSNAVITNDNHIGDVCKIGVYKNKRLIHSMTSLIGCLIEVQLEDGKRFEGILKTFSTDVNSFLKF